MKHTRLSLCLPVGALLLPLLLLLGLAAPGCVPDDALPELTEAQKGRVQGELLAAPPTPGHPLGARFGKTAELLGFDLQPPELAPGAPFTLTWYWRALQETDTDYMVFVHLDSNRGGKRLNLDHHPVQGLHPIIAWKKGQVIRDVQQDRLDPDFPEGPATLWVGVYHQDRRLPIEPASLPNDGASRLKAIELTITRRSAGSTAPAAPADDLPLLQVPRASGAIVVDGKLDEPAWQAAAWTGDFVLPDGKGGSPPQRTQAGLLWGESELFVAFRCEDRDIWTSLTRDDGDLWTEEVVELFLDPDGDGKTYVEIQVNPANALFDAYFTTRRSDLEQARLFSSRARHAVAIEGTLERRDDEDRAWTVELALPYDALPALPNSPPRAGDEWRANFFRMDLPAGGRQTAGAWSAPIVRDFHELSRFGRLRLIDGTAGTTPAARPAGLPPATPPPAPRATPGTEKKAPG